MANPHPMQSEPHRDVLPTKSALQNKRAVYAVVCETLKYQALLHQILDDSGFCEKYPQVNWPSAPDFAF